MSTSTPIPFLIAMLILGLAGYVVYRVGKRSTACGVTLGVGLIVLIVILAIVTAQVSWQVTLR